MEGGLQAGASPEAPSRLGSTVVVAWTGALLLRAAPLGRAYLAKLSSGHSTAALAVFAVAVLAGSALIALALRRRPATAAATLVGFAVATGALSRNAAAIAVAAIVLAATLCTGDLVFRLVRGADAGSGDLASVFGAGLVAVGLAVLALAEAGVLSRASLATALAIAVLARPRRLPALVRALRVAVRLPRGDAPRSIEAAGLAFAAVVVAALWVGALCPDVSWDGLAYHLPEAARIAATGRLDALPDLAPQSLLWRPHECWLAAGFLFGGEAAARFLQFAAGVAVFGASLSLARRLGYGKAGPLIVLALAAFPTAMLQLRATYVDWPAALLVTAAAAEFASARRDDGRLRLGALLFGGAVTVKVFALFAAPALLILVARARPSPRALAAAALCAFLPLAPWLGWSARHAGSIAEPYAASPAELLARVRDGHFFRTSPASGAAAAPAPARERLSRFVRLPYDLVFHSSRFEANGDGYDGIVCLAILVGLAGHRARGRLVFVLASLPVLAVWSQLALPSVRFLFGLYPLYAVFAAEGVRRLTSGFSGRWGAAAGWALVAAAAAFPVQFGSSGLEWRVAAGRLSREAYLEERLPSYRLNAALTARDQVILLGENDRFHCPAARAWRDDFRPVSDWGRDPEAWRRGLDVLGITAILSREDRRSASPPLAALGDRLEVVGRNGPAVLYRVRR
jgi:hypothetical protein